jgi:hypothetical protein
LKTGTQLIRTLVPSSQKSPAHSAGNQPSGTALFGLNGDFDMRVFLGMILGALLLTLGVYLTDSMSTSSVANGQVAQANRTIVNWDVAANDWEALKLRTKQDWIRISSR